MDRSEFTLESPGSLTPFDGSFAFVPGPLPPPLTLSEQVTTSLADAASAVGTLNGLSRHIEPDLLNIPYVLIEAIRSSEIEDIHTTVSDVLLKSVLDDPHQPDAVREVTNYSRALQQGIRRLQEIPLCLNLLRELHATLLANVRGGASASGEFRRGQVHIGGGSIADAIYVPPPVDQMTDCLVAWERYMATDSGQHPLIKCALLHYQFEAIHPFYDGNGRIGRLFNIIYLVERKVLVQPNLYLSAYFQRHRSEYYANLLAVSQRGDWNGWVGYFLAAVATTATSAARDCERLLDLKDRIHNDLRSQHARPSSRELADLLFKEPYITATRASDQLKVTFRAAQTAIDQLVAFEILTEITGRSRNRAYMARDIVKVIEGLGREKEDE